MAYDMTVTLDEMPAITKLESIWQSLERRCQPSFFVSWSWIGTWLSSLPEQVRPLLMRIEENGEIIGLALFVRNCVTRHKFLRSTALYLHATGDPALDQLFIEHNGFLVDPARREKAIAACLDFFRHQCHEWEEVFFDGIIKSEADLFGNVGHDRLAIQKESACHFVNLEKIRKEGKDYLSCLSSNTRSQIRRAIREYKKHGQVGVMRASSIDESMEYLSDLIRMHQEYWQEKGQSGAFSNPFFVGFHRLLIRRCFHKGEIQLLRIYAGRRTIGYLYNFFMGGTVYNYQSGFDYRCIAKHNRPGLVAHSLAIEHYILDGARVYDLLAGDSQYKKSLGTESAPMVWLVLQKNRMKFRLERGLRLAKHRMLAIAASS